MICDFRLSQICTQPENHFFLHKELTCRKTSKPSYESITLFWSPWGSKDSGCSKIKIAKVKACCYSTFTLAIYCFMDFATNVKKKKEKAPHTAEIAVKYSHYKILRRSLFL